MYTNLTEVKDYINKLDIAPEKEEILSILYNVFIQLQTPLSKKNSGNYYGNQVNGIGCFVGAILPDTMKVESMEYKAINEVIYSTEYPEFTPIKNYFALTDLDFLSNIQYLHDSYLKNIKDPEIFEEEFLSYCSRVFNIKISVQ